jgi:hypothetical protein
MSSTATLTQNAFLHHPQLGSVGLPTPHPRTRNRYFVESGPFSSSSSSSKSDVSPLLLTVFHKPPARPSRHRLSSTMATSETRLPPPCKWRKSNLEDLNAVFDSKLYVKNFPGEEYVLPAARNGRRSPHFGLQFLICCSEIEHIARTFERLNGSNNITAQFAFQLPENHVPLLTPFGQFYNSLRELVKYERPLGTAPHTTSQIAVHTTTSQSANKVHSQSARTNSPTPSDDSYTSSASGGSQTEDSSDTLANHFVYGTLVAVEKVLEARAWYTGHAILRSGYISFGLQC